MRKRTFCHVQITKIQIIMRMRAVWSVFIVRMSVASLAIQTSSSEYSDQTARRRRLICIFAGRTCQNVLFRTLRLLSYDMPLMTKLTGKLYCETGKPALRARVNTRFLICSFIRLILEFHSPVNNHQVMSGRSVNLLTLFLNMLSSLGVSQYFVLILSPSTENVLLE